MLAFQPVSPDNIARIRKAFEAQPYRACDYTAGAVWQWRGWFSSMVAFEGPCAVLSAVYPGKGFYYQFPCGGEQEDIEKALDAIERDASERNIPLRFCAVAEEALAILIARYGDKIAYEADRNWADYLYDIDNMKLFPGKTFHRQKNHLSRFLRDNPFASFVPVTEANIGEARAFMDAYAAQRETQTAIEAEELIRSRELLDMLAPLGMKAGFLRADAEHICAIAIGEVVGDTLYVHVEKADTAYNGVYQAIVSLFAAYAAERDTLWTNREDDSGDEGIRQSKEAYHPVRLVEKYWVNIAL